MIMKNFFFTALLLLSTGSFLIAQSTDENEIGIILNEQTIAWNKGDLDRFMKGYWNNDSLMFIGKDGITYGYQNTLDRYKKSYTDQEKRGKLNFEILKVKKLSNEYYFVLGKWFLKRIAGDTGGHYTLLFRKIRGRWLIVSDHSS